MPRFSPSAIVIVIAIAIALTASLGLSCGGASFARPMYADVARANDPWLEGARCPPDEPGGEPGVRTEVVEAGSGKVVGSGETVRVHYVAKSTAGATLHDTHDGGPPIEIVIGSTKTICGFERAILGMRAGEQRRAFVPWQLAFGEEGRAPEIPPRADLVFLIDLFVPADAVYEQRSAPVRPVTGGRRR